MTSMPTSSPVLVQLDKRRVDRLWMPIVGFHVLILVAVLVLGLWLHVSLDAPFYALLPLLILVMSQFVQIATTGAVWSGLRRNDVPLELSHQGLVMRSAQGEVRSAWESVAWVVFERHLLGRRLRIRLVPEQDPRSAGIVTDLRGRAARIVRREGMRYSMRILRIDDEALARAFAEQSGGRVTIR